MSFSSMTPVAGSNKNHSRQICLGLWSSGLNLATKLNSSLIHIFPVISKECRHSSTCHWDSGGLRKADSRSHPQCHCVIVSESNTPATVGTGRLCLSVQPKRRIDRSGMIRRHMHILPCNMEDTEHKQIREQPSDASARERGRLQHCLSSTTEDQEMQRCKSIGTESWG